MSSAGSAHSNTPSVNLGLKLFASLVLSRCRGRGRVLSGAKVSAAEKSKMQKKPKTLKISSGQGPPCGRHGALSLGPCHTLEAGRALDALHAQLLHSRPAVCVCSRLCACVCVYTE